MAARWIRTRWLPMLAVAIALPVAIVSIHGALAYWPNRVFPGFFVLPNALVPTIGLKHWTGMRADVPFHGRIVAIDDVPLQRPRDVYDHAAALQEGTPVRYTLVKNGETITRTVPVMRLTSADYWLTVGAILIFGILSIAAGVIVALLQPSTAAARTFLSQAFFSGLFGMSAPLLYQPDAWWLAWLHNLSQATFPAAFLHFGLTFPVERPIASKHPTWIGLPYLLSVALTVWMLVDYYATPPDMTPYYVICIYSAVAIAALVGLVAYAYWENRTPLVRPRLKLVLPALVLATAPAAYGFLNIARSGGDFPMNVVAFSPVFFYLSVGYAIVKHDLFDIDAIVKQTAVYGLLTLAVTATYAASVLALGLLLPAGADQHIASSFTLAFLVVVAVFFEPLRMRAQNLVDRTFYRRRLDYRRTVSELSAALTSLLDREEILGRVGRTVAEGLQLQSFAIVLWLGDQAALWRYDERKGAMAASAEPVTAAAREDPSALDAALVVPLAIHGETIGAFALGPRRSGRPFNREDIELLTTLAAQSAVAIQNASSYRQLQALNDALESKVRTRTAELESSNADLARAYAELQTAQAQLLTTEKMASLGLIVAGVAHEINNPLSFIVGNVEPLHQTLRRVRELASAHHDLELTADVERLSKILNLMALGAERTATIVQDLRTFSRLGEEEPRPTDLHDAIEVSLRLLRPRWVDRITIHRDYGALGPIDVIPGQINQVFMNLLANGCDAIPGRGNLWIRTVRDADRVVIAIRDDGSGIAPEHLARVFDPFFTTKPVGQGTGLGLAITQGIVSHHGGVIRVASGPGRGTEFQVVLPLAAQHGTTDDNPARHGSAGRRGA